jgi:hypothetical protein
VKKSKLNYDVMYKPPIGYWNIKKEKLRLKYPYLTDSDLAFKLGKEREMMEMLEYKMGISKRALLEIIVSI